MAEKLDEIFEMYGLCVKQLTRGRGTTILKTEEGLFQLKPLLVNESRIVAEYKFKGALSDYGFTCIDSVIPDNENNLVTYDRYGNQYVLRSYFDGRELNIRNREEIGLAVTNLAKFHIASAKVFFETERDVHVRPSIEFNRRNKEIKRVKNFMQRQKSKRDFELKYLDEFDYFYSQAIRCEEAYREFEKNNLDDGIAEAERKYLGYCHGQYNHHALLVNSGTVFTTGFDRFYVGNQLADLYHFLRKTLEKNDYREDIMKYILDGYNELRPLDRWGLEYIYMLYSYPEKYYKISNQYISLSKNWISPKMLEKLEKIRFDESKKLDMLNALKRYSSHF